MVVLVPLLRSPIFTDRDQLVKATIGEQALDVFLALSADAPPPPAPRPRFLQTGKLAKLRPARDGASQTDLTRVSAVVSIEQTSAEGPGSSRLVPAVVVVHNPFGTTRIPPTFFGNVPQLIDRRGVMCWSDRYEGP